MACITKRRGRYVLDFYDQDGRRQRVSLKAETTKKEARDQLREMEDKVSRRTYVPAKRAKTFKQVGKKWLEYKKPKIRISTWSAYEGHLKNHFEEWKETRIDRITTADVEKFITKKQEAGMNLLTLRKILVTTNQIFSYAVRHRWIDYNPVRDAERPRRSGDHREAERKITILSPEEIQRLLVAVESPKLKTLILLSIMTGARQGEALGLKWGDVDFKEKQIHIKRTFNHGRFFEPKSRESVRSIDIAPMLLKELAKWKLQSGPNDQEDFLFPSETGTPLDCHHLTSRYFKPALKKAGLPKTVRWHDMRHAYASFMLSQGENIKYVQNQLGHSSPVVTLQIYAHLLKPSNQEAVQRLENTLFSPTGHKVVTGEEKRVTAVTATP